MSNVVFLVGVAMLVEAMTGQKLADKIGWWPCLKILIAAFVIDMSRLALVVASKAAERQEP